LISLFQNRARSRWRWLWLPARCVLVSAEKDKTSAFFGSTIRRITPILPRSISCGPGSRSHQSASIARRQDQRRLHHHGPQGAAAGSSELVTPGRFGELVAAYIPNGQGATKITSTPTPRARRQPDHEVTATQAGADSGGSLQTVARASTLQVRPRRFADRRGVRPRRQRTHRPLRQPATCEFDLGTNYASSDLRLVPNGSKVTWCATSSATAPAISAMTIWYSTADRAKAWTCAIMCHQRRPSIRTRVTAWRRTFSSTSCTWDRACERSGGKPYQIIGFNQAVSDYSTGELPGQRRPACLHGLPRFFF